MITEADIWRSALAMVKRYKDDAMLEASARVDHALENGEMGAATNWHRILNAIATLQAEAQPEGEKVH